MSEKYVSALICLNGGRGIKYEIPRDVLDKICSLGSAASDYISYLMKQNDGTTELNFQRHSTCTSNILDYLKGDNLHIPTDVCPSKFKDEIEYWGIEEHEIESCCYARYVSFFDDKKAREGLENDQRRQRETKEYVHSLSKGTGWSSVQAKVWKVLEYPSSSLYAKVFFVVSNLFVMTSLIFLICNSDPNFTRELTDDEWIEYFDDDEEELYFGEPASNETVLERPDVDIKMDYLVYIDLILIGYFTIELLCKLVFFPLPWKQFITFLNVIDLIALCVLYLRFVANAVDNDEKYTASFYDTVDSLQIFRLFRLFRLVKNTSGFKLLVATFRASAADLLLLLLCLLTAVLAFAALAFFSRDKVFTSIPAASWWAIVTLTTVGYGDIVPTTIAGKLVAAACSITGVCLLAMLIPILVNNFILFYSHSKVLDKQDKSRNEISLRKSIRINPDNIKTAF